MKLSHHERQELGDGLVEIVRKPKVIKEKAPLHLALFILGTAKMRLNVLFDFYRDNLRDESYSFLSCDTDSVTLSWTFFDALLSTASGKNVRGIR